MCTFTPTCPFWPLRALVILCFKTPSNRQQVVPPLIISRERAVFSRRKTYVRQPRVDSAAVAPGFANSPVSSAEWRDGTQLPSSLLTRCTQCALSPHHPSCGGVAWREKRERERGRTYVFMRMRGDFWGLFFAEKKPGRWFTRGESPAVRNRFW